MQVLSPSSSLPSLQTHDSILIDDSTASLVCIAHDPMDDLLCEPFIGTPEPSLSSAVFEVVSASDSFLIKNFMSYDSESSHIDASYEPTSPVISDFIEPSSPPLYDDYMSYEISSPLSLLPFLLQPPVHGADPNVLPSFEQAFMDNSAYGEIIEQYQPQIEVEVEIVSVYELSDRTLIYEQL